MGLWLKQSTAADLIVGPFLDETNGKDAETTLTITQAEVRLSKNGGNMAQKHEATALSHDELGYYLCKLDGDDTDTLGRLQLMIHESGALPVYHEYMVVTANVYDTLCSTDKFDVQVAAYDDIDFPATQKTQITTIDTVVDAIKAKTDNLPADPASETNVDANETKIDTVDTVVDAIKAITDTLVLADIADAVHDEVVEGTTTLRQSIRLINSSLFGKLSGGGTLTFKFRDIGDTKDRLTVTLDANKNRTAVAKDAS